MDRLSAYAAREAESETPEERLRKEEEAAVHLLEKLALKEKDAIDSDGYKPPDETAAGSASGDDEATLAATDDDATTIAASEAPEDNEDNEATIDAETKKGDAEIGETVRKPARGIPEDVKLYEIFYEQVLNLVNVRAHTRSFGSNKEEGKADFHVSVKAQNLPVQDVTALLVSLGNLALNVYPDRLGEWLLKAMGNFG